MKKILALIPVLLVLVSCSSNVPVQTSNQSGYGTIDIPKNSTSTPTPFTPINTLFPNYEFTALPTIVPTATPEATAIPDVFSILPGLVTTPSHFNPVNFQAPFPYISDQETVTFLLLGSDIRSTSSFRTDSIIIVAFRPSLGQISMISIPRDLWVYIPEWGMQRINTAYLHGELSGYPGKGPGLIKDTILYNLGIRIDHLAMVDFNGFKNILDTIGGIDVPVACQFTDWHLIDANSNQQDENNWSLYTIGPGIIHMDGELALWYARSRKSSSDFDRGRRQQELLRAVFSKILKVQNFTKIPDLYEGIKETIKTDISLSMIMDMAPFVFNLNNADIRSYYIRPPLVYSWTTSLGAYVLSPNVPELQTMLKEAMSPATSTNSPQPIRIEIRNGSYLPDLDELALERLNYAGYQAILVDYDQLGVENSILFDLTTSMDPNTQINLLNLLGLKLQALISQPISGTAVDYSLLLGTDFNPCFKPEQINP